MEDLHLAAARAAGAEAELYDTQCGQNRAEVLCEQCICEQCKEEGYQDTHIVILTGLQRRAELDWLPKVQRRNAGLPLRHLLGALRVSTK
jgi:hypothetical protein